MGYFFIAKTNGRRSNPADTRRRPQLLATCRNTAREYNAPMRSLYVLFPFIIFVAALIGLSMWVFLVFRTSRAGWDDRQQAVIQFPNGTIIADVASATIKQYRGLSGHAPLAENTGMLFVFGSAHKYPFIMRGMTFPLDFVWINANRVVADIDKNVPPPTQGGNAQVVRPQEPITMVLEVPAGTINRLAIHIGDSVAITHEKTAE